MLISNLICSILILPGLLGIKLGKVEHSGKKNKTMNMKVSAQKLKDSYSKYKDTYYFTLFALYYSSNPASL